MKEKGYQISDDGISLDEWGLPDYSLMAAETATGQEHFVLVYRPGIIDPNMRYDWLSRHDRDELAPTTSESEEIDDLCTLVDVHDALPA